MPLTAFVMHRSSWPPTTGDAVHVWSLIQALRERGLQVLTQGDAGPPDVTVLPRSRSGRSGAIRRADLIYVRIDGGSNGDRETLRAKLARDHPPIVWEVNATLDELLAHGVDPGRVRRRRAFRRQMARFCDAAIVVSAELRGYVQDELGISDVTIVENGAAWPPPKPFGASPCKEMAPFTALWLGSSYYPWQASDTAVTAARLLADRDPEITVVVVGAQLGASEQPPPDNLLLLDPVAHQEALERLRAAAVALCIYHDLSWSPYGFYMSPIKLFEAWSVGVPVVATAVGSMRRLVTDGKTGLLVADDPKEVSEAVLRIKADPALAQRLGEGGRAEVRRYYNWGRVANDVADVMTRVVATRSRNGL